ncbi:MAG TPA: DNA polymerase III subunit alpha [Patescibacteria group bacterium]|jgi:DNA polymerase-3 subunit alpha|nr:DNA polymerase III subunit alpha [Patescibacteria group bacterium]
MSSDQQIKSSDYVHLHNHTHYSVLDGLQKIPDLLTRVKELGMDSVAITDHGTLSGVIEFYQAAKKAGIKPIIGMETYIAERSHTDKDPQKDKQRYHLILLAMNQTGYQNLMRLSTIANLDGFYYKPRIDHALLEKYNEGLIVLSGCIGGEVSENLRHDNDSKAREIAEWHKSIFGDRYYLEIQDHQNWDEQKKVNTKLLQLGKELDIPVVVTCDAHYLKHEDRDAHEILLCVGTSSFLNDQDRMSLKDFDLFVTDPQDVIKRWGEKYPEAITNTKAIANRCNVELEFGKILIPKFDVPEGETEESYLHLSVYRGLAWRYGGKTEQESNKLDAKTIKQLLSEEVNTRAKYELDVISSMGFNGYMLIVSDFITWGKDQGIVFGPGRGSAAGSIISYALKITELDPLHYGLLFERFLNPDRISMPDIDIDIQDTRRDEVIKYCSDKYGANRVANIATFGKMAARNAIRDVARVMQVPYADADRWAKFVPQPVQGRHTPLRVSVEKDPDLKKEYESNPSAKQVFDFAMILDGTIRSHGVHAAGVVIAPDEVVKFVPLEMAQKGVVATQYTFTQVEDLGLLKIDFLGLSNLSIVKNALRIIKRVHNKEIILEDIPLDDAKTFELFGNGDTTGVFQFESAGMKRYLRELKPSVFDDIIAMGALYRPGPMQFIDDFIARKHGLKKIRYLHPKMEDALKNTYGVLVYQEQVMQISKDLCGFTGGQADTLRKGVAKKIPEVLAKMKPAFIDGAVELGGANRDDMEKFWKQIEAFGAYCFNKSHSACYALIAYWTAYLKSHYPAAFMAALMTSDQDDTDRLAIEIAECQHMDMQVLAPDVNQSFAEFAVVPDTKQIRFGMNAVKNVGSNAVEEIIRVREESGKFTSIEDFAKRVSNRMVNRKSWESLIKAGAFDSLGNRSDLLFNLDNILAYASKTQKDAASGQSNLFGDLLETLIPALQLDSTPTRHSEREQLQWERELLGLYLSAHPLDRYDSYFEEQTVPISMITKEMDGKQIIIGGLITTSRVINTKNGDKMAFVAIEDKVGSSEIIVFPKLYETVGEQLAQDAVVRVKGKISAKDKEGRVTDEVKIIAAEINFITEEELDAYKPTGKKAKAPKEKKPEAEQVVGTKVTLPSTKLYVHVKDPADHHTLLKLKQTFNQYPGSSEVVLVLGADKKSAIRLPFKVAAEAELQQHIIGLYGEDCVALQA